MRTLRHHLILYDAECPMCKVYTRAFTKSGMLEPNGRAPYQAVLDSGNRQLHATCPRIDRQRAVNEIALIDTATGEVSYGIESMFKVIGHSFPLFRPLFNCHAFVWIMRKAYAFVSYNRKIIIPPSPAIALAKAGPASLTAGLTVASIPQPTFNLKYRLAYVVFTTLIVTAILTRYSHLLTTVQPPAGRWPILLIGCGVIFYNGLVAGFLTPIKRWDYLGNTMTVALAGALALLPVLGLAAITRLPPTAAAIWLMLVTALMLPEQVRRTKLLINKSATAF
ncbi:MAG TPA: hypothetical protein VMH27_20930 [Puia sp.]|nr:hypothetical protein [Puia sp.]